MSLDNFVKAVELFNKIAGKDAVAADAKLQFSNQLNLVADEVNELNEAVEFNDFPEVVKEFSDVMVTTVGLYQLLKQHEPKLDNYLMQVAGNNLSKFCNEVAGQKTVELLTKSGKSVKLKHNTEYDTFVVLDSNTNKVLKPWNYEPLDLSKQITKNGF